MTQTTVITRINTSVEKIFSVIADCSQFSKAVPHIIKVEYLSENTTGLGTRFRETRLMGKREMSTELEVTEYSENEYVRMLSDQGGTIWDTLFTVTNHEGQTNLKVVMDARAYKFLARIFNPLIKGMIKKAIEGDMDALKAYCERSNNET